MEDKKSVLMQFVPQREIPIYLKFQEGELSTEAVDLFKRFHFEVVENAEKVEAQAEIDPESRILEIGLANRRVTQFINTAQDTDEYNCESLLPKDGYSLYRVQGMGLLLYSYRVSRWSLGILENFGSEEETLKSRLILTRFLSWALAPIGVVGFWGVPVENGIVVMKQKESMGEPIFVNVSKNELVTFDGIKPLTSDFKIVRLDPTLAGREIKMTKEDIISFLSHHCTYFSESGLSVPVRQVIQYFSGHSKGVVIPRDKFQIGSSLSL